MPIPPIHHVVSESDTEMDDEGTQNAGMKRPTDRRRQRRQGKCSQTSRCPRRCDELHSGPRGSGRCQQTTTTLLECEMEGMQDETPLLEGWAAGEDPPPRSSPSGSGRSMLQCDVHKKHARKGPELCRVCARVVPQWCYACLRCGERFCSAACNNVALSARICGQDVRLGMLPQDSAVGERCFHLTACHDPRRLSAHAC